MRGAEALALDRPRTITRQKTPGVTASALGVALVVAVIPLLQGGLVVGTLPILSLITGVAFLGECRRFLFRERGSWRQAAPWAYVWLAVTLYIFGQAAAREWFHLSLDIRGIEFTRTYWLQHVEYWSFFTAYWLLAWTVSRQHGRSREIIVLAVILMAMFEALYGTVSFVNGQQTILGLWPKKSFASSVTGTFYNRDHLAGFFGVAMPLGAAYLMSSRWSLDMRHLPLIKLCITVMFLLIAGAALIGTASRLGIFSALVGFFIWAWLHERSVGTRWERVWLGSLVLLPVLAGLWFGPEHLIERLFQLDESTGRLKIWGAMFHVPLAVWVQGVGAGSFVDVFKLIQPAGIATSVWRAHSEYLQLAFEFGLVGIALLMPVAVYWFKRCRPRELGSLERGALAGIVAILVHITADFDIQVPGTSILFWIAVGLLFS